MITRITTEGITVIRADDGKWLQKGESYSNTDVYLGKNDLVTNWIELDYEPIPIDVDESDPSVDEVVQILAAQEGIV